MKSLYGRVNTLLEHLTFSKKTQLLIIISSLGMVVIGLFMMVSLFSIKYDYETLYQKRTLPQINLEDIKDIYSVNYRETLVDLLHKEIRPEDAFAVLDSSREILQSKWQAYLDADSYEIGGMAHFSNWWLEMFFPGYSSTHNQRYQKSLLHNIKKKIQQIDTRIAQLIGQINRHDTPESVKALAQHIFLDIDTANIYLASLIQVHLKDAIVEKRRSDKLFRTSTLMLLFLIGSVFLFSFFVALLITNHFKKLHASLETKVAEKTSELRALNTSLEKRITKEVANSRKKDQVMFQQAKLASMGEMLQNIAHQWRQPLGTLTMIIQGIESKYFAGKLNASLLESKVNDAMLLSKNMSETLEDFRTFFHPHKIYRQFTLNSVVQKAIDLTRYQSDKAGIKIIPRIQKEIHIFGYENELTHILLNLINNAKDALIQKGISHKSIFIIIREDETSAWINVIDNAGGIPEDIQPKIFEPYFTTKHKSSGTGIGLYMSKELIEKHMHGKILFRNIRHRMGVKRGVLQACTMFTVVIPKQTPPINPKE